MQNFTEALLNNSDNKNSSGGYESYFATGDFLGITSLVVGTLGGLFNFYILAIMSVTDIAMHPAGLILLKNQLVLDGLACMLLLLQQFRLSFAGYVDWLYYVMCYGVVRSMFLWILYCASAYNIVAVAAQRFVITMFPFKHISRRNSYVTTLMVYLGAITSNLINYILEMKVDPKADICVYEFTDRFANILWVCSYYLVPSLAIIFFYIKVILSLRKSSKIQSTSTTKNSEKLILKNAIVVAAMFIICAAPNNWGYFLMPLEVVDRVFFETFFRFFSYICTLVNSASTPIIYVIFLSSIRKKSWDVFKDIITCQKTGTNTNVTNTTTVSTSC